MEFEWLKNYLGEITTMTMERKQYWKIKENERVAMAKDGRRE